jgi:hypothetical protein
MDYKKIHDLIIDRAKNRIIDGYTEKHHIVPKCMGGNNKNINIVKLTAKEHWLIHLLLIEIYPDNNKLKIAIRKMMMKSNNQNRDYVISGKQFERLRKMVSEAHSKLLTGRKLKPFTDEHKKNLSNSMKGRVSPNKGKKLSDETKIKIGIRSKGRNCGDKNHMRKPEFREFMKLNNPMHKIKNIGMFKDSNNPNSKKVRHLIFEKTYNTVKECMEDLKINRWVFDKLVKKNDIIYV